MKRFMTFVLVLFFVVFVMPVVFTKHKKKTNYVSSKNEEKIEKEPQEEKYDYKEYSDIKLMHTKTGEVETLPIDEYLYGVVSAEMPAGYDIEALKAQATVARTYTIYQIKNSKGKHKDADMCDDFNCCQAWISKEDRLNRWDESERTTNWEKIVNCVDTTKGKIITYNGEPIDAFFHSNSGGTTETVSNVWGGTDLPYLQSVQTSGEEGYNGYNSDVEFNKEEVIDIIKQKHQDIQINFEDENSIKILEYTQSGRVKTVKFGNLELAGTEVRTLFGLKSTNFTIERSENKIKFSVTGYGHGVGMSQTGADSLAKQGKNYEEIIKHFYTGVEIENAN